MRMFTVIVFTLTVCGVHASAQIQERFLGVWRSQDPREGAVLDIRTNSIVVSDHGTNTPYRVKTGTNLLFGVMLESKGRQVEAKASYKFDEMFFYLGEKMYFVKKQAPPVKPNSEPDGAANGSQPFHSETNRTSSAVGSLSRGKRSGEGLIGKKWSERQDSKRCSNRLMDRLA